MRASELLTAIALPSQNQELQGIKLSNHKEQLCTTIKITEGHLIFLAEAQKTPLAFSTIVTQLMLHRSLSLALSEAPTLLPVYGFKEVEGFLIL